MAISNSEVVVGVDFESEEQYVWFILDEKLLTGKAFAFPCIPYILS
jgi:hypothetical protein